MEREGRLCERIRKERKKRKKRKKGEGKKKKESGTCVQLWVIGRS